MSKKEKRIIQARISDRVIVERVEEACQKYGGTMTGFVEECFMEGYQKVKERKERLYNE